MKIKSKLDLTKFKCIVIGVSAGGMETLSTLLPSFSSDFPLPIIIVQHIHKTSNSHHIEYYNENCSLLVKEAEQYEKIQAGTIYFAPPDYHLLIEDDETLLLSLDEEVNFSRPSIDVLFESAADVFGKKLIGIILTGANNDGAEGMKFIKQCGGFTIVQDPNDAEFPVMPQSTIDAAEIDLIQDLETIIIDFNRWYKQGRFT